MDTYTPEAAAPMIGISASSARNWCKDYAPLLSPGANPPGGAARRLMQADVAMLQRVKVLRDNRMAVSDIVTTLQQPATKADTGLTIDVEPSTAMEATPSPQEAHSGDLMLPIVLAAIDKRVDALAHSMVALEQRQAERVNSFVSGTVVGGAIVLAVVAVVLYLAR